MSEITIKLRCRNCQMGWWVNVEKPSYMCPECGVNTNLYNKFYKEDSVEWCQAKIKQLEGKLSYYEINDYEKTVEENKKLKKQMIFLLKWIKDHLKYMNIDYASFKISFENELKALEGKDERFK